MRNFFFIPFPWILLAAVIHSGPVQGQIPDDEDPIGYRIPRKAEHTAAEFVIIAGREADKAIKAGDTGVYLSQAIVLGKSHAILGNNDEAMRVYHQALAMAELADHPEQVARLKLEIGIVLYNKSQFDIALKQFIDVRGMAARSGFKQLEAEALNYIGKYYHSKGEYEHSLKYYELTLSLAEKIHDTLRMASVLNNLGKHYVTQGDVAGGLEMCIRSLSLQGKLEMEGEVFATTCNHLGNIYAKQKDNDRALFYHHKALKIRQSLQYREGTGKSLLNLGRLFYEMGMPDSAMYYGKEATLIFQAINYDKGRIKALMLEGLICLDGQDLTAAKESFEQARDLSLLTGYMKGLTESGILLGNMMLAAGQTQNALSEFKSSLIHAQKNSITEAVRDCFKGMQRCYESEGMYKEANACAIRYNEINEFLLKSEYGNRIANLQVHYETEQSRRTSELLRIDNELKNSQLERKNQWILTGIIMLFLLVALIVLLYSRYRSKARDNSKLKELNLELQQVSHEKDRLFSIIAHELRNPLWWFRNITETLSQRFDVMDKQKLNETLFALDESARNTFLLMDNLLNWSRSKLNLLPFHPVNFELGEVIGQSISQFNSMATQKKISINTDLRHSGQAFGDREQCNIVIRNILSNALKFTPANGTISLLTCDQNGCINLVVRDTGIGIDPKMIKNLFDESTAYSTLGLMQEKGSGLGLKLCREFAEKNGGSLEVRSTLQRGTTIEVTIPRQHI